jgi:hypothetical protein
MHTIDHFEEVVEALRLTAPSVGGFVESSSLGHSEARGWRPRTFNITLRVPAEYFDWALNYIESLATVTSSMQNAEDITSEFYDMLGRLETRRIEEERVLAFIEQAVEINDLLALEERLGQIRMQIEQYMSRINHLDQLATFSTIHVRLTEEETVVIAATLGGRIGQSFTGSLRATGAFFQNLIIFMAGAVVPLSVLALMALAGFWAVKMVRRKAV